MKYSVPEVGDIDIRTIILDLNGTLSVNGKVSSETEQLVHDLVEKGFEILLLTGDQRGTAADYCSKLGINFVECKNSEEKATATKKYNKATTAAIGNARIDIGTFENAILSIATLQSEGIHTGIVEHVDVIVPSIEDALKFFLDEGTFTATMRI